MNGAAEWLNGTPSMGKVSNRGQLFRRGREIVEVRVEVTLCPIGRFWQHP